VLTATSAVPSGIRIRPSVPSSTASTSIVALSVSISAMTSPALTLSPSLLIHLARLPFSIVGERAGISTWIGMGASHSLGDVFVPQGRFLADEPRHQLNTSGVVEIDHGHAATLQQTLVAGKVHGLADYHGRNLELDDGARA